MLLETIVADAKNNKPKAFCELYRRYKKYVTGILFKQGVDAQDIEDVSQTFWMKTSSSLKNLRDNSKFEPWLRASIINLSYDYKRKKAQQKKYQVVSLNFILDDAFGNSMEEIAVPFTEHHGERIDAEVVLEQVQEERKKDSFVDAAILYAEGTSYREIATTLGVKMGTVKSRIYRGRSRLLQNHAFESMQHGSSPPANVEHFQGTLS